MAQTALIELFLIAIGSLLTVISAMGGVVVWFGRKYALQIINGMGKMREDISQTRELAKGNAELIQGSEGTPWEGFGKEVKKSRSGILSNKKAIEDNQKRLKRHKNALKREGMLDPQVDMTETRRDFPDIDEINNTKNHDNS